MTKINSREALHILRLFEIAGQDDIPRNITYLKITELTRSVTATFVFRNYAFYMLFDDEINEQETDILDTLQIAYPGVEMTVVVNPKDVDHSFGMPHKGKTVYLAQAENSKQRLDVLLAKRHTDISRSTIQKYIKEGFVTVNQQKVLEPKQIVSPDSVVVLTIPQMSDHLDKTIPIIYEDENVLVLDKPEGVLTHSKGALNDEFTVANFLRRFYADDLDDDRPGIVHRLDRDTSGVIICAKNAETAKYLRRQFSDRNVKKTYYAILEGQPKQEKAIVDLPIARNMNNPSTFKVDAKGKSAVTKYEILENLPDNQSFVKFNPVTGRTHQLRVHAKYLNAPIKGDRVYGQVADRMYLHASELEITIPGGKRMIFKSDLPKGFR